jgi:hypothetical protein
MTGIISIYAAIVGTIGLFLTLYLAFYKSNKLEVIVSREKKDNYSDAIIQNLPGTPKARFFHITVKNKDKRKPAENCKAYLISLKEYDKGSELLSSELPLKWKGYQPIINAVEIPPLQERKFDAFHVLHQKPDMLLINAIIDSTSLLPRTTGRMKIKAEYKVTANGFKTKHGNFVISLSPDLDEVDIKPV